LVVDIGVLRKALANWREGQSGPLLAALGFTGVGLRVPRSALSDFGIDPSEPLTLEVAARFNSLLVLRIAFARPLEPAVIRQAAAALYRHNPTRRALLIFEGQGDDRLVLASWGLGPGPFQLSKLWIDLTAPRRSELDILSSLAVNGTATASEAALAHVRALDREQVTQRFFNEFRRHRAELAAGLAGLPVEAQQDRLDLALVILNRLLFLYFVQKKGWLAGDAAYLRHLYEGALDRHVPFYRRRLKPLFFSALNRSPADRRPAAKELGELPYLNGGLFERVSLERKYPRLDVPDDCFEPLFSDLLDKYQFTLREDQPADQDVALDPEMLGRAFEGLMSGALRESTGAFFTPRTLVGRLVDGALFAHLGHVGDSDPRKLEEFLASARHDGDPTVRGRLAERVRTIRVLDPAVGSGAFLMSALQRLERLRDALEGEPKDSFARFQRRREIIQRNLYGVDVNGAAVRLCELRLWLALAVDLEVAHVSDVPPLPNLDINIRQGDALVDPIDFLFQLGDLDQASLAVRWKREVIRLQARRDRYFDAGGATKRRLQRSLRHAEWRLACTFVAELIAAVDTRRADLTAAAHSRDLFGKRAGLTHSQKKAATRLKRRRDELSRLLRRIQDLGELPFFSFPIHFANPGDPNAAFDVVIGNPPWVRPHHWAGISRQRLKERFRFLGKAGWRTGSRLSGAGAGFGAQADLSTLFLERSLGLLKENGALGFLLPAKVARCLAAGAAREYLVRDTKILKIEDCALATTRMFEATTYPLALLLRRQTPVRGDRVAVCVHDRRGSVLDFHLDQSRLPLCPEDPESPWVLAPSEVRSVFDRMRSVGRPIGAQPGRRPRRGIFTGANAVFVGAVADSVPSAGLVRLRVPGCEVEIESERLRPVLRGEDLSPWSFTTSHSLIWPHDDDGEVLASLPRATRGHLQRHQRLLKRRIDLRPGSPYWSLFRVRPEKWALRVAWRDIAPAPEAAVVPPQLRFLDDFAPVISLNTVYQITAASGEDAHLLAAVLNSTVARAYLRAIAERASGGYFRFLGWTVALLPFPERPDAAVVTQCAQVSREAHAAAGLAGDGQDRLDAAVATLYGLTADDLHVLRAFDDRLSNPVS
jgi:hypothetical protein